MISRRSALNALAAATLAVSVGVSALPAQAAKDTIKVGVLHSLSGTMAISETTLKDSVLMMIDKLNKEGGLLGKKVEAVVVDPASNWPLFAEKARELIQVNKVDVVFGCWTSVSRKSVLPVFEELNGMLFYPVQYEGEESSRNVFYTGAAPNQQAIPAVEYLMSQDGGGATTRAIGEEGQDGGGWATTMAVGEEGQDGGGWTPAPGLWAEPYPRETMQAVLAFFDQLRGLMG